MGDPDYEFIFMVRIVYFKELVMGDGKKLFQSPQFCFQDWKVNKNASNFLSNYFKKGFV